MHPRKLGDIIILRSLKKEIGLPEIQQYLDSEEPYVWSSAITALGHTGGRPAYDIWLKLLEHENNKVVERAILAAGDLKDSRCIFPMANMYLRKENSQLRFAAINALAKIGDPRGIELLPVLLEQEKDPKLRNAIENCIKEQDYSEQFLYTFNGPEEKRLKAIENDIRIKIKTKKDFYKLSEKGYWDDIKKGKIWGGQSVGPQTFIVDKNKDFYIGGPVEEHVKVAKGQDVLAAGEVWFGEDVDKYEEMPDREWPHLFIYEINHRSYGYCPAQSSLKIAADVLLKAGFEGPNPAFVAVTQSLKEQGLLMPGTGYDETAPKINYFSKDFLSTMPMHPSQKKKKRHT